MATFGKPWQQLSDAELAKMPVPNWDNLPAHAQRDLQFSGFDKKWFAGERLPVGMKMTPELQLTVLVLYVKMKGLGLWYFVKTDMRLPENWRTEVGKLHFHCPNFKQLKAILDKRADFTDPEASDAAWSSREKRCIGSLEFKRFTEGDDKSPVRVQAHIDPYGLIARDSRWLFPPIQLGCAIAHGFTTDGFLNVNALRTMLLRQGWDPATLLGKSASARRTW